MPYIPNRPQRSCLHGVPVCPNECIEQKGFSPMLSALLGMVMGDGFCNTTAFHLLRDIFPYVECADQDVIRYLLGAHNTAAQASLDPSFKRLLHHQARRPLTRGDKTLSLLRTLKKYSGMRGERTLVMMERMFEMRRRTTEGTDPFWVMDMMQEMQGGGAGASRGGENGMDMAQMAQMMQMMNAGRGMGQGAPASGGGMDMAKMLQMMQMMNPQGNTAKSAPSSGGMDMAKMAQMMQMMQMMNGMKNT